MKLEELRDANVRSGINQCTKALEADLVKKVFIARDADASLLKNILLLADQKGIPVEEANSMKELGQAVSIEVGSAVCVLLS